jgi:hypothetical protein
MAPPQKKLSLPKALIEQLGGEGEACIKMYLIQN